MLCFGQVCASLCALNASAALQGTYITPFPTEVVRAIRVQRDEAYVWKIVCRLHVMASNPHPPPLRAPHLHHFYFSSPQPIRSKEASDSDFTIDDVMLWLGMRFSLRSQCKRCSAGRLYLHIRAYAVETSLFNLTTKEQRCGLFVVNNGCSYDVIMRLTTHLDLSLDSLLQAVLVLSLVAESQK